MSKWNWKSIESKNEKSEKLKITTQKIGCMTIMENPKGGNAKVVFIIHTKFWGVNYFQILKFKNKLVNVCTCLKLH
jgi:hypothetical protein